MICLYWDSVYSPQWYNPMNLAVYVDHNEYSFIYNKLANYVAIVM